MPKEISTKDYLTLINLLACENRELHILDKLRFIVRDILRIKSLYNPHEVSQSYFAKKQEIEQKEIAIEQEKTKKRLQTNQEKKTKVTAELEGLEAARQLLEKTIVDLKTKVNLKALKSVEEITALTSPEQRKIAIEGAAKNLANDSLNDDIEYYELMRQLRKNKKKHTEKTEHLNKICKEITELSIKANIDEYMKELMKDKYIEQVIHAFNKYSNADPKTSSRYIWLINIFISQKDNAHPFNIDTQAKRILKPISLRRILINWFDSKEGKGNRTPEGVVSVDAINYFITYCQQYIKCNYHDTPRYTDQIAFLPDSFKLPYAITQTYELINSCVSVKNKIVTALGLRITDPDENTVKLNELVIATAKLATPKSNSLDKKEVITDTIYLFLPSLADGLYNPQQNKHATLIDLLDSLKDILNLIRSQKAKSLEDDDLKKLDQHIASISNAVQTLKLIAQTLGEIVTHLEKVPEIPSNPPKLPTAQILNPAPANTHGSDHFQSIRRKKSASMIGGGSPRSEAAVTTHIATVHAPEQKDPAMSGKQKNNKHRHKSGHHGSVILRAPNVQFFTPTIEHRQVVDPLTRVISAPDIALKTANTTATKSTNSHSNSKS